MEREHPPGVVVATRRDRRPRGRRTPIDTETLVVDGAQVLVASAGEVACFALETGAFLWQDTFKGMGVGPVSLGFPGNTASVDRA